MTKHRKILEGVSEYPLEETEYDNGVSVIRMPHESQTRMGFANPPDAKFWLYAYRKWPAICDLIDAVELLEKIIEADEGVPRAFYELKVADQLATAFEALDKLNGKEEK